MAKTYKNGKTTSRRHRKYKIKGGNDLEDILVKHKNYLESVKVKMDKLKGIVNIVNDKKYGNEYKNITIEDYKIDQFNLYLEPYLNKLNENMNILDKMIKDNKTPN